MNQIFREIKIVGLDDEASRVPPSGMADIFLNLSDSPPNDWVRMFHHYWKHKFYTLKCSASVVGSRLQIGCLPEDLKNVHLPELKKVIAEANLQYTGLLAKQEQEKQEQLERDRLQRQRALDLKKTLKFD
ncbi:hypothetical protein [Aestuariivirga sp.]|uniref:hypothetical protein n=1 Tax=Aestuariivirga sp. TaxID=2650926 RepID=UPI0035B166A1